MKPNKKSVRWKFFSIIAILASLIATIFSNWSAIRMLENKTIDWRLSFHVPIPDQGKQVAVVLIDDAVLDSYSYRSPVPRDLLAKLIDILSQAGAKRIGLDFFLKDLSWEEEDEALAESLKASGRTTLVSNFRKENSKIIWDLPHSKFLDSVDSIGLANLYVDPIDQILREAIALKINSKIAVPTLAGAMFLTSKMPEVGKPESPEILQKHLPSFARDGQKFIVNFLGPPYYTNRKEYAIKTFSASKLLKGLFIKKWFTDKYIFIGAGFSNDKDLIRTPYYSKKYNYPLTARAEIHANILSTLLNRGKIRLLTDFEKFLTIFVATLFSAFIFISFSPMIAVSFEIVFIIGLVFTSLAIFKNLHLLLPMISIGLGMGFTFIGIIIYKINCEGRQKRWIKNAFQMYLAPEVLKVLSQNPEKLNLTGEERELSIMFTDLQGFTSISETLEPKKLVNFLRDYFDGMTEIVFEYGGTIDKYVGDAIMVFWNAPVNQLDHAERSVLAAIDMIEFSKRLSSSFGKSGNPEIRTRIGINTGKVIVGNVGSKNRFNYTVMGDMVNTTAWLEGINKKYGTFLIISESTFNRVQDKVRVRKLDVVRIKDKTQPICIYELIGKKGSSLDSNREKLLKLYYDGLIEYNLRNWDTAKRHFKSALQIDSDDGPSKVYLERCEILRDNPPEKNWDGVFNFFSK